MSNLIRLDEILRKLKEKGSVEKGYTYVYRKSAMEMSNSEMRDLIDDIDEITTCLVEEVEMIKTRLAEVEKLNMIYVDLMRKLVKLIVISDEKDGDCVLSQIKEWVTEENKVTRE